MRATMQQLAFALRHPNGQARIAVPSPCTWAVLRREIERATSVAPSALELRFGYPPALVEQGRDEDVVPLKGGTLVVCVKEGAAAASSSSSSPFVLVRRIVPADNSCLFSSFAFCLLNRVRGLEAARRLRNVVAQELERQVLVYSEVVLGKDPRAYREWILLDAAWGGAIEVAVLAQHMGVEVGVFDVQSGRVDMYESPGATRRIYLLYDGIHYDPLARAAHEGAPEKDDECTFALDDEWPLVQGKEICRSLKAAHAFTDTSRFTLRCLVCGAGLAGEDDAMKHAQATKPPHTNFAEYAK